MKRSSKSMRYVSIVGLLLAVSLALFMFAGCTRNAVNSDEQNPTDEIVNSQYETGEADQNFAGPKITFDALTRDLSRLLKEAEKLIDSKGGILSIELETGIAKFEVPTSALKSATLISIKVANESDPKLGSLCAYDCGPDGTTFAIDAKLSHPVAGGKLEASIYYFNEATGAWEFQEKVKVSKGYATFSIKHFSKYGIS